MEHEEWKPVPDFEGYYEASSLGRLRRIVTHAGNPKCAVISPHEKRKTGYSDYWLFRDGNKPKRSSAHRLLWRTFYGEIPKGMHINHKNGKKRDNRIVNLELLTPSQNTAHAYRVLGRIHPDTSVKGERNGSAKLNPAKVREIRALRKAGEFQYVIAKKFGVSQAVISQIDRGNIWSHVLD